MSQFDAVGFGALNVDKLFKVEKISGAEEESSVIDYSETCGGSAANTMVGMAKLACKVGFIGKVAADPEGKMLLQDLMKEKVDVKAIVTAGKGRSGKVMGFVDRVGQRALYIDPGVNDQIEPEDVNQTFLNKTRLLHLTSFVGERSFHAQKWLLGTLPETVQVSFDPGALYARRGMPQLRPIIGKTTIMLPNSRELALITDKSNYRDGARLLLESGVKTVAVKLGNKGCYVTDYRESHLVAPFKVKVVDTTGAGDAFDAGFLYGLLNRQTLFEAAIIGNFVASRCIMAMGARSGLPTLQELKTDLRNYEKKSR
jgi:ribokinase